MQIESHNDSSESTTRARRAAPEQLRPARQANCPSSGPEPSSGRPSGSGGQSYAQAYAERLRQAAGKCQERPESSGSRAEPSKSREAADSGDTPPALGSTAGIVATPKGKGVADRPKARDGRWALARTAAEITKTQRQLNCGRATTGGEVQIFISEGQASFAGVQTCGLLWACPVCATKITEQRRADLKQALDGWEGQTATMTRTFSHTKWDKLGSKCDCEVDGCGCVPVPGLLEKLRAAHRLYSGHRTYKTIRVQFCATTKLGGGVVRGLEVTHAHPKEWAHSGWHPHEHDLWFCNRTDIDAAEVEEAQEKLAALWIDCCRVAGLTLPSMEHGLVFELGKSDEYVAKWGMAEELTKGHLKQGKLGNVSTWGLLHIAHEGGEHAPKAKALYKEFVDAFKGRHQLQWTPGLRGLLGLKKEKTDAELAARVEDAEANFCCEIESEDWRLVQRPWVWAQSQLLSAAEKGGEEGVENFLAELRARAGPAPNPSG